MTTPITCELLEERLAALHAVSLELVQDISLPSLLQRLAILGQQQTRARYVAVGVVNADGKLEHFTTLGMNAAEKASLTPPQGAGLIGELMRSSESIRLDNLHGDPGSLGFPPGHPAMTSFLGIPIRKSDHSLGFMLLTDRVDGIPFSADDQQVAEILAAYAAAAISNAHLYEQIYAQDQRLMRRTENLSLINRLASTLAASTDIDLILENALHQVMDYLRVNVGEIYLRQEDSDLLKCMIYQTPNGDKLWKKIIYRFGEGVIGKTAQNSQPCIIDQTNNTAGSEDIIQEYYQVICFPLTSLRGTVGVLSIALCDSEPLEELEIQFLSAITAWIGMVIDNVRLGLQQRRLAVLEERERIGMDLHDGIIQSIYGVGLSLENVRMMLVDNPGLVPDRIDHAIHDLNDTIRDIRSYILDLTPRHLRDDNLLQGIHRLTNEFRVNTLVDVNLVGNMEDVQDLPEAQAIALFHICQEALANTAKHARARKVSVSVWTSVDRALMEISDDGRGFESEKAKTTLGHGLANMQTRAINIGGDIEITSEVGIGTTILAWVPFIREQKIHA